MAIYNFINNIEVWPEGKQKTFLLQLYKKNKCVEKGVNYNGYGYADKQRYYTLTENELNEYNALLINKKPVKVEKDPQLIWAKRLIKFIPEITLDEALLMAQDKIDYKKEKITELENQNAERFSMQREKLIKKMYRENPLRYIRDQEHAYWIMEADKRHNCTNYEATLKYARELAEVGNIEKSNVKIYARKNFK